MQIIKLLKEIGRNPYIDWVVVLFMSLVIFVTLGYFSLALYNDITKGSIHVDDVLPSRTSSKKINEKTIAEVIERFSDKDELSRQVRSGGYSGETDPSI